MTTFVDAPRRVDGVQLLGEVVGSGYRNPPALVRRSDGQVLQLTPLLFLVLDAVDGHRSCDDVAALVGRSLGRHVTSDDVRSLIDGVENGGIISYFYNSGAGTVADCLDDLTTLGALGVAEQVRRVSSLFPGSVPADLDDRNRIIDSWPDEGVDRDRIDDLLQDADAVLMPLMADLEAKLASFLEASELAT